MRRAAPLRLATVFLNFGTMLYARQLVRIGDRSKVGQYSILADCEVPEARRRRTQSQ